MSPDETRVKRQKNAEAKRKARDDIVSSRAGPSHLQYFLTRVTVKK